MEELGVSINKLERDLRDPVNRINEIVNGKHGITRIRRYGWLVILEYRRTESANSL